MTFEERVKSSFDRVRDEMNLFFSEISSIKNEIKAVSSELSELKQSINPSNNEVTKLREELNELRYEIMAKRALETKDPSVNSVNPNEIPEISTGNRGVSTLRHFDTQTDNTPPFPLDGKPSIDQETTTHSSTQTSTHLRHIPEKLRHFDTSEPKSDTSTDNSTDKKTQISDLAELMESLKSDLKRKFEALTKQEFYIFSVLFTVDKTQSQVTYQDLAARTGLTSSSIRDYVQRIIQKGIPLVKERLNNKTTVLKIPPELRNLATLDNLMRIRGLSKNTDLNKFTTK